MQAAAFRVSWICVSLEQTNVYFCSDFTPYYTAPYPVRNNDRPPQWDFQVGDVESAHFSV